MSKRIGVVGISSILGEAVEPETRRIAAELYPDETPELVFAPRRAPCGHFNGSDEERATDFLALANDPSLDAVWFARGGYGSGRLIDRILNELEPCSRDKDYLGYSDAGSLLAALYTQKYARLAHGPMPYDALIYEQTGESVRRALRWLVEKDPACLDDSVDGVTPTAAFNLVILSNMAGTYWMPDLTGHVLILEEVKEEMYRIDRCLFQLASNPFVEEVKEIRLGRWDIKENIPDFGMTDEALLQYWCDRMGVPYGGRAEVGHYEGNKVVPLGIYPAP